MGTHADANSLFNAIDGVYTNNDLDFIELFGLATDGCPTNVGRRNGLHVKSKCLLLQTKKKLYFLKLL